MLAFLLEEANLAEEAFTVVACFDVWMEEVPGTGAGLGRDVPSSISSSIIGSSIMILPSCTKSISFFSSAFCSLLITSEAPAILIQSGAFFGKTPWVVLFYRDGALLLPRLDCPVGGLLTTRISWANGGVKGLLPPFSMVSWTGMPP